MKRLIFLFTMILCCAVQVSAQEEKEECTRCHGRGQIPDRCAFCKDGWRECDMCLGKKSTRCYSCGGSGWFKCYNCQGRGYWVDKHGDKQECQRCGGVGTPDCERCKGKGEYTCTSCEGKGGDTCRQCNGSGEKWWTCPECFGKGYK